MLRRRSFLPLCTLALMLVLLAMAGWLTFSTPRENPLSIKLLKVSLVTPAATSTSKKPGRPYEEVEYKLQNTSRLAVEARAMRLRDSVHISNTLALDYNCRTPCQLGPGESCRRSMRIQARPPSGASSLAVPLHFAYFWQPKAPSLKMQIRGWYNRMHKLLPQRLRARLPEAEMFHTAVVADVASPAAAAQGATAP